MDEMKSKPELFRPQFHFTPERNWMNDPNGLVYFKGEYHLFYQHHPHGTVWGPMHWGHAVSRDLVHWEHLPVALYPDQHGTIFSGSAVVDEKDTSGFFGGQPGVVAIFTHDDTDPVTKRSRQRQSLAYSCDSGRTWVMYEGNPVLSEEDEADFRDPKVFWHDPTARWVMVLAAGNQIKIYVSVDLKHWQYASSFGAGEGNHEGVWECPDLFEMPVDGDESRKRWVMIVSVGSAEEYTVGSRTQYFIGDFDGERFTNGSSPDTVLWLDHGRDNYAGVTWSDIPEHDGRRIYIGWMNNWKYAHRTPTVKWRGAMTLPRVLSLRATNAGIRLVQNPVQEMKSLRLDKRVRVWRDLELSSENSYLSLEDCDTFELLAEFELDSASQFGIRIRTSSTQETVIGYDVTHQRLFVDRRKSGQVDFSEHFPCVHEAILEPEGNRIKLHLFVDWSSVEVFAVGGLLAVTDQIFPDPSGTGLMIYANGGTVRLVTCEMYPLRTIYDRGI